MPIPAGAGPSGISLDEMLSWLKLTQDDAGQVALFLAAAEDVVAEYIGSPLQATDVTETHARTGTLILGYSRVVGAVTVTDSSGAAVTSYEVQSGGVLTDPYGYSLPPFGTAQNVTVSYTAGFETVPAAIRLAVFYIVQQAVESEAGAVPVAFQSGADESFTLSRGFAIPNRAKEYLAPFRRAPRVA